MYFEYINFYSILIEDFTPFINFLSEHEPCYLWFVINSYLFLFFSITREKSKRKNSHNTNSKEEKGQQLKFKPFNFVICESTIWLKNMWTWIPQWLENRTNILKSSIQAFVTAREGNSSFGKAPNCFSPGIGFWRIHVFIVFGEARWNDKWNISSCSQSLEILITSRERNPIPKS